MNDTPAQGGEFKPASDFFFPGTSRLGQAAIRSRFSLPADPIDQAIGVVDFTRIRESTSLTWLRAKPASAVFLMT